MEALYRDQILDHYRHPRNYGPVDDLPLTAEADNPLCGDRIRMGLRLVESLCRMATVSGFDVIVDDPRATTERFPDAVRVYTDDLDYSQLRPRNDDFVVVATQHKGDHHSVSQALHAGAGYIALVASRKRARLVLESLRGDGFTGEQLEAVVAPAGLDLGGRSPEEIALAILGEMVLLRHGGSGQRLKDRKPL